MSMDLVSVVMPAYNASRFIDSAIRSVIKQSYPSWELIVVDDGSSDGTQARVENYARDCAKIRLIQHRTNRGPAAARNTGIENANGHYIAFLDSDDLWHSRKLEKQIQFMDTNGLSFTYTSYLVINENGAQTGEVMAPLSVGYEELLRSNVIGCLTSVFRRDLVKGIRMREELPMHEDYVFWLDILGGGCQAYGIQEPLASYRIVSGSFSRNKLKASAVQWRIYREYAHLGLWPAIRCFSTYASRGVRMYLGFCQRFDYGHLTK